MTLEEILNKNKATLSIPLPDGVGAYYSDYHAHIQFANGKIEVDIYSDEGVNWETGDTLDMSWIDTISKFVGELKESKIIPEYTLDLLSTPQE